MQALVSGEIALYVTQVSSAVGFTRANRVRAYAVTAPNRQEAAPEIPTLAEAGVPGYQSDTWYALLAPAATPAPVLLRLRAATEAALQNPALRERFVQQGAEPGGGGPAALDELMRADLARWRKVVADAKLRVD